jgi:hypothetical protein
VVLAADWEPFEQLRQIHPPMIEKALQGLLKGDK